MNTACKVLIGTLLFVAAWALEVAIILGVLYLVCNISC